MLGFFASVNTSTTITTPSTRRVFQRNGASSTFTVSGTYSGTSPSTIQIRAIPFQGPVLVTPVDWMVLDPSPSNGMYSGSFTLPQGGWYSLQVRGDSNNSSISQVDRIGVGECFLVAGQSNAGNWSGVSGSVSPLQQVPSYLQGTAMSKDGIFSFGADPQPSADGTDGSPWPRFMDLMLGTLNGLPICVCTVAIGGTVVHQWIPSGSLYPTLVTAMDSFNSLCGGFRCILWFQGESDSQNGTTQANYQTDLRSIITQSRTDSGNAALNWGIGLESYFPGASAPNIAAVLAAQTAVAGDTDNFAGPAMNSYLGSTWRSNDPDFSIAGAQEEAALWQTALQTQFGW